MYIYIYIYTHTYEYIPQPNSKLDPKMPQPGYPIGRTWNHAILLRILHPVLVPCTIMLGKNNKFVFRLDLNTC